jgi:protein-S-isoprenylcysteine O-methyltransferase Ste14
MKGVARKIIGVILIIVGLVALVTPFSPGSWLALIGLELLGFGILLEKWLLPLLKPRHRQKLQRLLRKFRRKTPDDPSAPK